MVIVLLVCSSAEFDHAIVISDRRHRVQVQAPESDLSPCPPHRSKYQTNSDLPRREDSEDAVAISPLPPHYHRRVQRGRRCHVEHPKNCLRKGKACKQSCRYHDLLRNPLVVLVNCWIAALTNFSSFLFSLSCREMCCAR